jgi:hypothetical protein
MADRRNHKYWSRERMALEIKAKILELGELCGIIGYLMVTAKCFRCLHISFQIKLAAYFYSVNFWSFVQTGTGAHPASFLFNGYQGILPRG